MSDTIIKSRFSVSGLDCAACAAKVDAAVRRLASVEDVSVSASTGKMTVQHREDPTLLQAMRSQLRGLGYGLLPAEGGQSSASNDQAHGLHSHAHDGGAEGGPWWQSPKALLTAACGGALAVAYGIGVLLPEVAHWTFLLALAVGLVPIAWRAISAALVGTPFSIETLMTIAAVGAILIGETEEAAIVVLLFLVGELLEGVAAGRARASIRALTGLVPKTALLEREGGTQEVPAESLKVGSIIVVRPGDRIPADGAIIDGDSAIAEAPVTGESTPVRKGPGAAVFAGTINTDAVLRVRVTAAAQDNTVARVVRLVEEAQESKAPTERFIDRFSRYYTPAVLAVGALVAVLPPLLAGASWSEWVYKGLAILLIGCPCALVISTPAAIAAALSAGARRGLLMKGGVVLETMGKITAAAFDKTGTLTEGRPVVTDVVAFSRSERQVLSMAAALESGSNHPLALAILEKAKAEGVPIPPASDLKTVAGRGVSGRFAGESLFLASPQAADELAPLRPEQKFCIEALNGAGKTVSVLVAGNTVAGLIAMRDEPRADAKTGIQALKAAGVTPIMLTGDNSRTAQAIAESLGIEPRAQLLPEDKQRIVRDLQAQGHVVAKVGDGINDAPALAAANVGIAMGGGTDVALETADAAVLHGRVLDVARMVRLSKAAMANIRQNIVIALGLKAVFLVTTVLGVTGLWPAILADTGATVLVTANAMRLLRAGHDV
ncbi:MAG TPA: heavy metal translocating P-type ATPase [Mesorhizobium sp.]|nr:heavy metal translocating P-type ATPase [Mesorhizobium sp.]